MYHEVVDVTEDAAVQAFCRSAAGALDVVNQFVNTVGVVDNMGDVVDLAPEVWVSAVSLKTWREVFAVNVEAALTASQQAAVRQMSRPVLPADDPKKSQNWQEKHLTRSDALMTALYGP